MKSKRLRRQRNSVGGGLPGRKVVGFTCGAFDLCHYGHVLMFKECKDVCDYLIVGIQDDPSVDRLWKNKPIQSLEERAGIVSSIRWVDKVLVYKTEKDLYNLLKKIRPDVRILGADWEGKNYTGWDLPIKAYFNKRDHEFSTSELRKRVYEIEQNKQKK